jgi:hypothetical protein
MPEELRLPLLAAALLAWYLSCALRQLRSHSSTSPVVVWREATTYGWSDWATLKGVLASAGYDAMLCEVRDRAHPAATAVQFAVVVRPDGAPDYTLRVLFMSNVREVSGRALATSACEG